MPRVSPITRAEVLTGFDGPALETAHELLNLFSLLRRDVRHDPLPSLISCLDRRGIAYGLLAGLAVVALIGYWFGAANRHAVFLYQHVDQPGQIPLGPFHRLTVGRYWMTGFVAGGFVASAYLPGMLLAGWKARRRGKDYCAPEPVVTWLISTTVVVVGVPWITTSANQPTMPAWIAVMVTLACTTALGLALSFGPRAAKRPRVLLSQAALGGALVPHLTTWRAIELPVRGIITMPQALAIAAGGIIVSALFLRLGYSWVDRTKVPRPSSFEVVWAGLAWHALGHPLAHYLLATPPGFPYITTARNVFADSALVWLTGLAVACALAGWIGRRPRPLTRGP